MFFSHLREDGVARFYHPDPSLGSVHVTGNFCDWEAPGVALKRAPDGWFAEVGPVPDGDVEYKLIVDGRWVPDPLNLTRSPDGRGGDNSLLPRSGHRGTSYHLRFYSPAVGEKRGYVVHLPAAYFASSKLFPVLYLLHGALDWERTWLDKGGLAPTLEHLRSEGTVGDLIIVMPREAGDLHRGDERVADSLARDVVGHIDYEFRTLASPRHRGLDGLSTGGFTSLLLGASRSDTWRSVGSMSGSYDERNARVARSSAAEMRSVEQRYLLSCGHQEPHYEVCRAMFDELQRLRIESVWVDAPGSHDWPVWRALIAPHLRFHWQNLQPRGSSA